MSTELPHVDLNALVQPVATVEIDKTTHDVLPVQGDAMSIFEEVFAEQRAAIGRRGPQTGQEKEAEALRYLDRARRIVYCVAPSIPKERVLTMTASQLTTIAGLSMDAVKKVQDLRERAAGKDGGPAKRKRTTSGRK